MSTRSLGSLTVDLIARTGGFTQGMSKAEREVARASRSIRQSLDKDVNAGASAAAQGLQRFSAQVISLAAAWQGLSTAIGAADTWTNLNNRLRLVTDGQDQFVAAQENVLRIARESRQPLEATAELYQRIAQNQDALGLSGQEVADIVETISKAMVVSGSSAQGAQAALVQLGQAFASGTLRGEELNSVLEQAPALANAIAAGLGVPIGKLRELGKAGELTADQVIGALQSQAAEIDSAFSTMDSTVGQALTNVRTNLTEIIGRFSDATGAASSLASVITALGNNLPQVAAAFGTFASVKVTQQLAERVRVFRETQAQLVAQTKSELASAQSIELKTRAALLDAQAEVRRAQAIGGSVAVSAQAAQATLAHRQAVIALEAAQSRAAAASNVFGRATSGILGFFGGPSGLAFMVATTAASWLLFRDNTSSARQALIDFNGTLDESIEKFSELNRQQQAGEILRLQGQIADGYSGISQEISEMANAIGSLGLSVDLVEYRNSVNSLKSEFHAGRISADEFSARIAEINKQALDGAGAHESLRKVFVGMESSLATNSREYERQNDLLSTFTGAQNRAAGATDNNTDAIREQAATLAAAKKSLNDYIGKMDQVINQGIVGIVRKSRGEFAALQVEVGQMINAAGGVGALDPQQRQAINSFLAERRRQIEEEKRLDDADKASRSGVRSRNREAEQRIREQESAREELRKQIEAVQDARNEFDSWAAQLSGPVADANYQFARDMERLNELAREGEIAAEDLTKAQAQLRKEHEANLEAIEARLNPGRQMLEDLEFELSILKMTNAERATAIQLYGMTEEAVAKYGKRIAQANRDIEESMKQIELMDGARNAFANFFEDVLSGTKSVKDAFSDMLDSINRMIMQRIAENWVEQLFGAFGTNQGGSAGGNWFGQLMGAFFGGGKAGGGIAAPWHMYEVNERGMEMATVGGRDYLLTGSKPVEITPNHRLGGGAGPVNVNFYNPVLADRRSDSQRAAEAGRKIRLASRNAG